MAYFNLFKSISSMPASVLQLEKFNNGVVCLYSHTLGTGCATGLYAREYTFIFLCHKPGMISEICIIQSTQDSLRLKCLTFPVQG